VAVFGVGDNSFKQQRLFQFFLLKQYVIFYKNKLKMYVIRLNMILPQNIYFRMKAKKMYKKKVKE
jgi:hypothetical protein